MPAVTLTDHVDGIVHEPTQTEGPGLDLTVAEIYEITEPGRVDFGGGELASATTEPHPSAKRNQDDDYEWWVLDSGQYLIEYNETLSPPTGVAFVVQIRDELLTQGVSHPTLQTRSLDRVPLSVGGAGLKCKENARVSTIRRTEQL
jgi:deoxycytidine triphosphate deaminase